MTRGNKVGLGSDVAGGYHPSILESARSAVVASLALKHAQDQQPAGDQNQSRSTTDDPTIDFRHAVWLASAGGAEALGLEDKIGSLQVGLAFDAFVLGNSSMAWPDVLDVELANQRSQLGDIFQKLWNLGDDRNISHVFVQGNLVHCSPGCTPTS